MNDKNRAGGYVRFVAVFLLGGLTLVTLEYLHRYAGNGGWLNLGVSAGVCAALALFGIPVTRCFNKARADVAGADYFRAANWMAIFSVISFVLGRMPQYISQGWYTRAAVLLLFACAVLAVMAALMIWVKPISRLAVLIPSVIFIAYTAGTLFIGGQAYYFLAYLVVCGIGAIYFDYRKLLWFLVLSNGAILILAALRLPLLGAGAGAGDTVIQWLLSVYTCVFFIMLLHFSAERNSRARNAVVSFRALMATTPNLVAMVDDMNRVMYISRPMVAMAKLDDHRMAVGRPLIDLFPETDMKLMISAMLTTTGYYEHIGQFDLDGETRYIKMITDDIKGGDGGKFIDISDITPIIEAKIEAEKSAEAKSLFLANTSHEIRTPMNAILGMVELQLRDELPQSAREKAVAIRQASSNLLSIINDVLDFSKIESGKLEISPAEYGFASLMNDIINIIRTRVAEKPVLFTVNIDSSLPCKLVGDEARVRQVLLNLLSNAVKFTEKGGIFLGVTGEMGEAENIQLSFVVSDTGVGIKEDDVGKLFDNFIQLEQGRNRNIEGTGLGLAISRNLCQIMGGDILVSSEYGRGSVFTAIIPQAVRDFTPIALVEAPETKDVLLYETRAPYADSIVRSAANLGVRCKLTTEWEGFREALERERYPFVFVASRLFAEAREAMLTLAPESTPVLLADYGETAAESDTRAVAMPAHSISIANVLRGPAGADTGGAYAYGDCGKTKHEHIRFVAPEARILIVDDITTNLKVAEGLLAPYEARIDCCGSGQKALEFARQHEYDIIFMDHMMPDMDGVAATAVLRSMEGEYFRKVPVIALTANAVSGMKEMFMENGFSDYLAKPIEVSKLNGIMARWIPPEKRRRVVFEQDGGGGLPAPALADPLDPPENPLRIEGVDAAQGLALAGGLAERYREILSLYCRDAAVRIPLLAEAPDEAGLEAFVTQVHALKSASANIGATELAEEAVRLEAAGRSGDRAFIRERLPRFYQELTRLTAHIQAALDAARERRKGRERRSGDRRKNDDRRKNEDRRKTDALTRLKAALEAENIGAVDELLNALISAADAESAEDAGAVSLERVADCVLLADFGEAVRMVDVLLRMEREKNDQIS
ncbi:MAG: response regulator [Peptococcaceae bacterium]|nr:response regulator [Peptococcaceae bacterium]